MAKKVATPLGGGKKGGGIKANALAPTKNHITHPTKENGGHSGKSVSIKGC